MYYCGVFHSLKTSEPRMKFHIRGLFFLSRRYGLVEEPIRALSLKRQYSIAQIV